MANRRNGKVTKNSAAVKRELSKKKGTVSKAILDNKDEINTICMSGRPCSEVKAEVIAIIESNAAQCPSLIRIIETIKKTRSNNDLMMYLYNLILAGDNLGVVA